MLSGHGCKEDKGSSTIPIIEGNPKPFQILVFKTTYSSIVGHFIVVDFMDKKCNNALINEHFYYTFKYFEHVAYNPNGCSITITTKHICKNHKLQVYECLFHNKIVMENGMGLYDS